MQNYVTANQRHEQAASREQEDFLCVVLPVGDLLTSEVVIAVESVSKDQQLRPSVRDKGEFEPAFLYVQRQLHLADLHGLVLPKSLTDIMSERPLSIEACATWQARMDAWHSNFAPGTHELQHERLRQLGWLAVDAGSSIELSGPAG